METTAPTIGAQSVASAASGSNTNTSKSNVISADFETFLQLLTTQMKNQDPTNPQDSTEFVAQLASFSAVEQQVSTNQKLEELVSALTEGGLNGLSNWIGADVRSTAATEFSGNNIDVFFTPPQEADAAYVSVKDEKDVEVARVNVEPTASKTTWDGTDFTGAEAEAGKYSFAIIGLENGTVTTSKAAETYSQVTEARTDNGEVRLFFADGSSIASREAVNAKLSLAEN